MWQGPRLLRLAGTGGKVGRRFLAPGAYRSFAAEAEAATPVKKSRRWLYTVGGLGGSGLGAYVYTSSSINATRREAQTHIKNSIETPIPKRDQNMKRLASGEEFDILVVGGGATGAGVALEAQLRGLNVACIEQEDFGSGTSAKSTKLLWAGSRYLVKGLVKLFSPSSLVAPKASWDEFLGTFHMVMGCFRERTYMLNINPHITNWVPIAVPLDKWIIWPAPFDYPPAALGPCTGMFIIFFKFYDALGFWNAPSSYVMSSARATQEFPQMDGKRMKYVSVFYEGAHNDTRTNMAIALTAAMKGSCMCNYAKANSIIFDDKGVARGATVKDETNPDSSEISVRAKKVVYCGGPFTDGMRQLSEGKDVKPIVNGSGGTHIVLPQYYCPRHIGMVDMMTSRGSFLFFLPWEGYTLVGTTDVKTTPDLHHEVPEDEIQYLINETEKYLSPNLQVRRRDVMSAWYGIRPLVTDPHAVDQSSVSRDHTVSHHPTNGITFISGGKWTTWREMAEDCVDQVVERDPVLKKKAGPSKTLITPLVGAGRTAMFPEGYHENVAVALSQKYDLAWDIAQNLAKNYGTRASEVLKYVDMETVKGSRSGLYKHYPRLYEGAAATTGYPYLEAEVRYCCEHEWAVAPCDILGRRTRLAYLNATAAKIALPKVVDIMAECHGWDEARKQRELENAEVLLAKDFAGPVPNKVGASIRTACTADVKDIFDSLDVRKRGTISRKGIKEASVRLGFPLDEEHLSAAMREMDQEGSLNVGSGEINFPQFLMWWNSSKDSLEVQKRFSHVVDIGSKSPADAPAPATE